MGFVRVALALCLAVAPTAAQASDSTEAMTWHRVVSILQYVQTDYANAIASGSEQELQEQRAFADEAASTVSGLGPIGLPYRRDFESLEASIAARESAPSVAMKCVALANRIIKEHQLLQTPHRTPDLRKGEAVFAQACAACHGVQGDGVSAIAATMDPRPANFHDPARMGVLSPYRAFNAVTFGLPNTAMPSFASLDDDDRWAAAFFLFTLRQPPCPEREKGSKVADLEQLATSTDTGLAKAFGPNALSCLRRKLPALDEDASLLDARVRVEEALKVAARGETTAARQAFVDAYLLGVEPAEPKLRSRDADLVTQIERSFLEIRSSLEKDPASIPARGRHLINLLDTARRATTGNFASVFWVAALILLREGFEAAIVIAALLAVLKKMNQPQHARVVHLGWVTAVAVGAGLFIFGREALAGANREWMEGIVGLVAVALLLNAALWLNTRANIRKFMGDLRGKMQSAIGNESRLGLFAIAFLAMLRESAETAIFLHGLATDAPAATAWGAAAGLVGLLAMVLMIRRVGYRLPMKPLFTASTFLLVATAIVMLGKALHALQETGSLPLVPIRLPSVELLGVFPDAVSFAPQLLLTSIPLGIWLWRRRGITVGTAS